MIPLIRVHDVNYGLVERTDLGEMADLLASVFSRFDPPAIAAGLSFDDVRELVRHYGQRVPDDALTVIARSQPSGKLIGAMLTDDFADPPPKHLEGLLAGNFKSIGAILEKLDGQYRKIRQVHPGTILHLFMLGVDPAFGGKGIARNLVQVTLENGRQKGYQRAVTEATGRVSQHIFRSHGFEELFRVPYQEFIFDGERPFSVIVDHEAIVLLERAL